MWGRRGARWPLVSATVLVATLAVGSCSPEAPTGEPTVGPPATTPAASSPAGTDDPLAPHVGDARYDVERYEWHLELDPSEATARVATVVAGATTEATDNISLDYSGPPLDRVSLDGEPVPYDETGSKLLVAAALPAGRSFTLEASYEGEPKTRTDGGPGGTGWVRRHDLIHTVHLLPGDAASWVPVNDTPLDPATYRITLTVPDGFVATASGREIATESLAGGATRSVWEVGLPVTEAGFAVGRFERSTAPGLADLDIDIAATAGARLGAEDLALVPEMLEFLEGSFGPFPFDALGITWTGHPSYLGDSMPGRIHLSSTTESVLVHELAHQWIGGAVGVASTRDAWLREGLPTYVELLWAEHRSGAEAFEQGLATYRQRLGDVTRAPLDVREPADQADDVAYLRGALTWHALHQELGHDGFWRLVRELVAAGQGGVLSTEDLRAGVRRVAGSSGVATLDAWLTRKEVPGRAG